MNSVPHLGTAYTTVAADALARYRRMTGHDVRFLTGLDEHGQKVAQAAEEHGMTPQEWVRLDRAEVHSTTWEMLDISNDDFIRTTEQRHKRGVQAFLAGAPRRRATSTRATTRAGTACPTRRSAPRTSSWRACARSAAARSQFIREDNWFFKLSEFQDRLLEYYEAHPEFVQPETRRNEVAVVRAAAG